MTWLREMGTRYVSIKQIEPLIPFFSFASSFPFFSFSWCAALLLLDQYQQVFLLLLLCIMECGGGFFSVFFLVVCVLVCFCLRASGVREQAIYRSSGSSSSSSITVPLKNEKREQEANRRARLFWCVRVPLFMRISLTSLFPSACVVRVAAFICVLVHTKISRRRSSASRVFGCCVYPSVKLWVRCWCCPRSKNTRSWTIFTRSLSQNCACYCAIVLSRKKKRTTYFTPFWWRKNKKNSSSICPWPPRCYWMEQSLPYAVSGLRIA